MLCRLAVLITSLASLRLASGQIQLQGINLAGLEFYTPSDIDNSADLGYVSSIDWTFLPNQNGSFVPQVSHFDNLGFNTFRFPFSWQRLQPNLDGQSPFDASYYAFIQTGIEEVTRRGSYSILDVHNYARVNGNIIGQGGPSADAFADFWKMLARDFSDNPLVIFGLMNEPHDLDMPTWTNTLQMTVNAIRSVPSKNIILLPGTAYTGLTNWLDQSYPFLSQIINPDNTTRNLVYDIHHYWDGHGGNYPECSDTPPEVLLPPVTERLSQDNRQAFLSETGGGNGSDCVTYMSSVLDHLANHAWLGYTLWGAGEFDAVQPASSSNDPHPEALTLTPHSDGSDQPQIDAIYTRYLGNCNASGIDHNTCRANMSQPKQSVSSHAAHVTSKVIVWVSVLVIATVSEAISVSII